jgi:hypothetical protein
MVHIDDVAVPMALGHMPVRVSVRLWALPALMRMLVMLVMDVQMLVLHRSVLVLEPLGIARRPQSRRQAGRDDY